MPGAATHAGVASDEAVARSNDLNSSGMSGFPPQAISRPGTEDPMVIPVRRRAKESGPATLDQPWHFAPALNLQSRNKLRELATAESSTASRSWFEWTEPLRIKAVSASTSIVSAGVPRATPAERGSRHICPGHR